MGSSVRQQVTATILNTIIRNVARHLIVVLGLLRHYRPLSTKLSKEEGEDVNGDEIAGDENLDRDARFFFNKCVCRMPNLNRTIVAWGFRCWSFSSWCPSG